MFSHTSSSGFEREELSEVGSLTDCQELAKKAASLSVVRTFALVNLETYVVVYGLSPNLPPLVIASKKGEKSASV